MRKITAFFLVCLLPVCFLFSARGEMVYPARQGQVTDLADVIGEETEADVAALSSLLQGETQGALHIVTRHFLGGKDAALYARRLFDEWALNENDALLLMVVGEERYALALGEKAQKALPDESRTALLGAFRTAYLSREYDRAVGDFSVALAKALGQAQGKSLSFPGLFGQGALPVPTPPSWEHVQENVSGLWQDIFGEIAEETEEWKEEQAREEVKSNWKTILVWGLVIYFLFFRKKIRKKKRRR